MDKPEPLHDVDTGSIADGQFLICFTCKETCTRFAFMTDEQWEAKLAAFKKKHQVQDTPKEI